MMTTIVRGDLIVRRPDDILDVSVDKIPGFIIFLHRLARLGKGNKYMRTWKAVQFWDVFEHADKWPDLKELERVTLLYEPRPPRQK